MRAVVLLPALLAAGCLSGMSPAGDEVPFRSIARGGDSGVEEPTQVVITAREEWEALWARHARPGPDASPPPDVDFAEERVLAVFLGSKPTGAWAVDVERVEKEDGRIVARYRVSAPSGSEPQPQGISQPFHIVAIPGGEEPVVFRE